MGSEIPKHMTILNPIIRHEQIPTKRFIIEIETNVVGDIGQHTAVIYQLLRKLLTIAVFALVSLLDIAKGIGANLLVSDVEVIAVNANYLPIIFPKAGGVFIKGEQFLDAVHEFFRIGVVHMCDILGVGEGEQYLRPAEECQGALAWCA